MKENSEYKKTGKSALITFVSGAAVVYAAALYYCFSTGNQFAATLLIAAVAALSTITWFIYRSM